jgi:hypothetical protein
MKAPKLPTSLSEAWSGGFALPTPGWTSCVTASGGTVLAAGEQLYLLRRGATTLGTRELPAGIGDAVAVGVDPRRRDRMVVVCAFGLVIFDGPSLAVARNRDTETEFAELAWGPATSKRGSDLYILRNDDAVLRLSPGVEGFDELDLPPVVAMTSDEKGQLTYASFDEDDWSLDVHVHASSGLELRHTVEAPAVMEGVYLARAGSALAVGVENDRVWLTRCVTESGLSRVEALSGGPVTFEGTDTASALFGVNIEEKMTGLIRVDANGDATRIGELGVRDSEKTPPDVQQLAWDSTRKTLWAAAGAAGLLSSTAPGNPPPGAGALS